MIFVSVASTQDCHPRESGGPGEQTRSCNRKGHDTRNVSHGALVPRLRGDDGKGSGDCKLRGKNTLSSDPIIFLRTVVRYPRGRQVGEILLINKVTGGVYETL